MFICLHVLQVKDGEAKLFDLRFSRKGKVLTKPLKARCHTCRLKCCHARNTHARQISSAWAFACGSSGMGVLSTQSRSTMDLLNLLSPSQAVKSPVVIVQTPCHLLSRQFFLNVGNWTITSVLNHFRLPFTSVKLIKCLSLSGCKT